MAAPADEAAPLQLVERARHRFARRADHVSEQRVADREVDSDPVADDTAVGPRQLQELAAHALDMSRVSEVRERLLLLGECDLEQLNECERGLRTLEQATSRFGGEPHQTRRRQAEHHLVGCRREQHPSWSDLARDDRTCETFGRAANNDEAVFEGQQPGPEKRPWKVRFARVELEPRTAGEELGDAVFDVRRPTGKQPSRVTDGANLHHMFVSLPARALTSKLTSDRSRLVRPPEKSNPDPKPNG